MSTMVKFTVNGSEMRAEERSSLLAALQREGYDVPSLCFHEAVSAYGACRLCLVEIKSHGRVRVATSCNYPVSEGIEVVTDSEKVLRLRRTTMELHLAFSPASRPVRDLAERMGVFATRFRPVDPKNDCVLCGLCQRVCSEIVNVHAISFSRRGGNKLLSPPFVEASQECIACGACVYVCPSDCIRMEQTATYRKIDRWGRICALTRSELSGLPIAPTPQLEYFRKIMGLPADFYKVAPGERSPQRE